MGTHVSADPVAAAGTNHQAATASGGSVTNGPHTDKKKWTTHSFLRPSLNEAVYWAFFIIHPASSYWSTPASMHKRIPPSVSTPVNLDQV